MEQRRILQEPWMECLKQKRLYYGIVSVCILIGLPSSTYFISLVAIGNNDTSHVMGVMISFTIFVVGWILYLSIQNPVVFFTQPSKMKMCRYSSRRFHRKSSPKLIKKRKARVSLEPFEVSDEGWEVLRTGLEDKRNSDYVQHSSEDLQHGASSNGDHVVNSDDVEPEVSFDGVEPVSSDYVEPVSSDYVEPVSSDYVEPEVSSDSMQSKGVLRDVCSLLQESDTKEPVSSIGNKAYIKEKSALGMDEMKKTRAPFTIPTVSSTNHRAILREKQMHYWNGKNWPSRRNTNLVDVNIRLHIISPEPHDTVSYYWNNPLKDVLTDQRIN